MARKKLTFQIEKVIKSWNISTEAIEKLLPELLTGKYFNLEKEARGKILVYYYETWGRCRRWKLVVMKKSALENKNSKDVFIKAEFINESSNKNAHIRAYIPKKKLPREFVVYYYESPSCNGNRRFSFKVLVKRKVSTK